MHLGVDSENLNHFKKKTLCFTSPSSNQINQFIQQFPTKTRMETKIFRSTVATAPDANLNFKTQRQIVPTLWGWHLGKMLKGKGFCLDKYMYNVSMQGSMYVGMYANMEVFVLKEGEIFQHLDKHIFLMYIPFSIFL